MNAFGVEGKCSGRGEDSNKVRIFRLTTFKLDKNEDINRIHN